MLNAIAGLILSAGLAYSPPVDYAVTLAGNFGEPRPNHFHCGIDVKTGGVEGKRIYAIADGYVSRITVGLDGFGNALYITHPDGRVSVYCHLRSFTPKLARMLRRWQYAHESWAADVRLAPGECPVSRGQWVAVSGNTGASLAPHLHLELRDALSGHVLDPLDVLGFCVGDSVPPMAHGFMACPVEGEGTFSGMSANSTHGFASHRLQRQFTAWGRVGFAIWANDYMDGVYNKFGVRQTVLKVDGREVFRCDVDRLPPVLNAQVNHLFDYSHYYRFRTWYQRAFLLPGVTLPFASADANRGIVDFSEERDYHVEYELTDFFGNISTYSFTVTGRRSAAPRHAPAECGRALRYDRFGEVALPGVSLVLPPGALSADCSLSPRFVKSASGLSPAVLFSSQPMHLMRRCELSIAVRQEVANPGKLYIVGSDGRCYGGRYASGWVTANVRDLGVAYRIAYDDSPPAVAPLRQGSWHSSGKMFFRVGDGESGVKSLKGYVDGRFVLFEKRDRSDVYMCDLRSSPLPRQGRKRTLRLIAEDRCGNKAELSTDIFY